MTEKPDQTPLFVAPCNAELLPEEIRVLEAAYWAREERGLSGTLSANHVLNILMVTNPHGIDRWNIRVSDAPIMIEFNDPDGMIRTLQSASASPTMRDNGTPRRPEQTKRLIESAYLVLNDLLHKAEAIRAGILQLSTAVIGGRPVSQKDAIFDPIRFPEFIAVSAPAAEPAASAGFESPAN